MLSDPGCVPQDARPVDPDHYRHTCSKCDAFKPLRAHHCRICNRCVVKMDHHCPWVNNCVGLANQKFFLLFVGYTMLMSLTALGLVVVRLATCTRAQCGQTSVGFMVSLIVEAVLFGLFTLCMLCDQLNSIFTNTTGIDRLKGHNTNANTNVWANLAEVFGGEDTDGFSLLWLLPTRIHYPDPEALTGFCFRDTPRPKSWVEMETLVDPADLV